MFAVKSFVSDPWMIGERFRYENSRRVIPNETKKNGGKQSEMLKHNQIE